MAAFPSTAVYCWGNTAHGQLGLGAIEDEQILVPRQLEFSQCGNVTHIGTGLHHSVLAGDQGVYSCGCNDEGQLGHAKLSRRPGKIELFDNQPIRQVVCGNQHSLALTDTGQLFTWGSNSKGQLGRGDAEGPNSPQPKLVRRLSPQFIIQVACGYNHCLALSNYGSLYSWGDNGQGQLGVNNPVPSLSEPTLVSSLQDLTLHQVSAGAYHSFALTVSGTLLGWGRNRFGQLGIGNDTSAKFAPTLVRTLKSQGTRYVSCGEEHTAVITMDGGVFTFGAGMYGQLGHNSKHPELLPKKVFELMGSVATQVACGRCHTLAYIPSSGCLYSFGLCANGQLGVGPAGTNRLSPSTVKGPFVPVKGKPSSMPVNMDNQRPVVIKRIYAGGDQSFLLGSSPQSGISPDDFRLSGVFAQPVATLCEERMRAYSSIPARINPSSELMEDVEKVFSSVACHNGSFLLQCEDSFKCTTKQHGVDLEQAVNYYARLAKLPNKKITESITTNIEKQLLPSLKAAPPDIEALRVYLTLPYCHAFEHPVHFNTLLCPFARAVCNLQSNAAKILDRWWATLSSENFIKLVKIYNAVILFMLQPSRQMNQQTKDEKLLTCLKFLKKLNTVNEENDQIIPVESFYIPELQSAIDIRKDYLTWIMNQSSGSNLAFCSFPFVFDAHAKTILLHSDAMLQMQWAMDEVARHNLSSFFQPSISPLHPCLVLVVSRNNIVQDTINQIQKSVHCDLKKPLKVIFIGEDAVDEGGVRKEFFLLMMREILDPKYGMFASYNESRLLWFQEHSFEDNMMFRLIGILCGLAIYNATIIDLKFPLAIYKKLLQRPVTLDDMLQLDPSLGRSLKSLLQYEGDDLEETFCLTFDITREVFGEIRHIPLLKNGENVPVNKENRQQYVDSYIDYVFNISVKDQFTSFYEGFHRVCGGRVLKLFHPQELQAMVIGNENYDWDELEKNAEYKGEFTVNHPCIQRFWNVFRELSHEDKKRFLLFLTGSDRIPIQGMKAVKIYIQPTGGGDDFLPVAHTCFNLLDLPQYQSEHSLRRKLLLAIQHSQGFALV